MTSCVPDLDGQKSLISGPDFVIIGAMKAATSTLHSQLALQPGIWMSDPKEPNFFSDAPIWSNGLAWYSNLFSGAGPNDLRGESSTHYTKLPGSAECLPRMLEHIPDAKLIYLMRHPIDRLVSHYIHAWTEAEFSEPIDLAIHNHSELIDYGRYAFQLSGYLKTYGPEKVLPVFFDRLVAEPQSELERICSFLGYQARPLWDYDEHQKNSSSQRLRRSPARDALLEFSPLRFMRRTFIPKIIRNRIKKIWQMDARPDLSDKNLEWLISVFDRDLKVLSEWLGTSINCENFKRVTRSQVLTWSKATLKL